MSNLQPNCCLEFDFQKVDQHAGGKWLIHDTKRRKDNQLQSLKLPCKISKLWWRCSDKKNTLGKLGTLMSHCVERILSMSKKKYDQPMFFLFDGYPCGPSTKTILIWDGRNDLVVTLLIWKRQPRYTA